ncbi:GDSL-type esterase/lipase family protein [Aeromicrobium sp.]|uniref:GDSL-type esterase/lipase family protein n=1 Tax=Aeromicrobium sp. TaxID=1871063 RepID=UPI0019BFC608|nr:GDSL-type esterase/lipase family protein [Aeromicrobium sp.]MBC7631038.1 hypothetical protein [Aeromicrobium sp.]
MSLTVFAATQAPASSAAELRRVLVTGDSITQGSSGDYTWRYRLWKKLTTTAPAGVTFVGPDTALYDNVNNVQGSQRYAVNFAGKAHGARWGTTFIDQLPNVGGQVTASSADVLIVALGYNDLSYFTSPAATIANAKSYIQRARAAKPGIDVVIAEVTNAYDPWTGNDILASQTAQYAALLPGLRTELNTANERVEIVKNLTGWIPRSHTWDGVHPNATGETIIAQRVSEALSRMGIGTAAPSIVAQTAWGVAGPAPAVTAGPETATVSWSRVSSGATGMFLNYQIGQLGNTWEQLPYAVGADDRWTMEPLVAGGDYGFALTPAKGFMTGLRGATARSAITALPFDRTVPAVFARTRDGLDATGVLGTWRSSSNPQGYLLGYRTMAHSPTVTTLPYSVGPAILQWDLYPLAGGRYYQFMVRPTRGFVEGSWVSSTNARTRGIAYGRAYIALGDSYSSGLGAKESAIEYEMHYDCRRTGAAWPFQMQPDAQTITALTACQGDTLTTGVDGGVRAQMSYISTFFAQYPKAPQLVTATVGGNDVGFSDKLKSCVFSNCSSNESAWSAEIGGMFPNLHSFYNDLRDAAPNADIVVGGYPVVVDPGGNKINAVCTPIGDDERQTMRRLVLQLNDVIHRASQTSVRTGVHKTQVWSAGSQVVSRFNSHGACQYGDEEWIHSLSAGGGSIPGMNSFHPKPAGQLAYAFAFADAISQNAQ